MSGKELIRIIAPIVAEIIVIVIVVIGIGQMRYKNGRIEMCEELNGKMIINNEGKEMCLDALVVSEILRAESVPRPLPSYLNVTW